MPPLADFSLIPLVEGRPRPDARTAYPNTLRIFVAMQLARDLDTCAALLRGDPVDPSGLDRAQLEKAREQRFVVLVAPIDLLKEAA